MSQYGGSAAGDAHARVMAGTRVFFTGGQMTL